jgi:hypothetical protein
VDGFDAVVVVTKERIEKARIGRRSEWNPIKRRAPCEDSRDP